MEEGEVVKVEYLQMVSQCRANVVNLYDYFNYCFDRAPDAEKKKLL